MFCLPFRLLRREAVPFYACVYPVVTGIIYPADMNSYEMKCGGFVNSEAGGNPLLFPASRETGKRTPLRGVRLFISP